MKVARLHAVGDLRVSDEQVPAPGPGMSLVRVTGIGICGSDLHWWGEAGIGDWCYVATRPPSTARVTPWTKLASSLARKTIAAASSSG